MSRADRKAAQAFAATLTAAAKGNSNAEYRAVAESDDNGPGFIIERRDEGRRTWGYMGWYGDLQLENGRLQRFGQVVAL